MNMSREEFIEMATASCGALNYERIPGSFRLQKLRSHPYYEVEWVSGGMRGGDCWGGSADMARESDPEPELDEFDAFLASVCPTLSFTDYRKVLKEVVERDSRVQSEYYGNYTTYSIKRIHFDRLYDALENVGVNIDVDPIQIGLANGVLKIVPVTPTHEMLQAAQNAWTPGMNHLDAHEERYRAMLSFAPDPKTWAG